MPDNEELKIYSIQPRFKMGDAPTGWALVEGIFKLGDNLPPYGSPGRDYYLSWEWQKEPMTAGVFSTCMEKAQTVNWKVTGPRELADEYAKMYQNADHGAGWTYHEGVCYIDYLSTDKGDCEELGRESLDQATIDRLQDFSKQIIRTEADLLPLNSLLSETTFGKVVELQHIDAGRLVKVGLPGMRWRLYPDYGKPVSIPDDNMIQITSMPSARDRYRGYGYCTLSRIIDAKNLMIGYLNYYRQEIGNLPPELVAIINGMDSTTFMDALNKYKMDKKAANLDEYGKIFFLGSDDPLTQVTFNTTSLTVPNKSFNFKDMVEWWMKVLALNVGEDIGEFWLLQRGESKTVQSIQAMKSRAKGVARYLQEKERKYNMMIQPYGTRFEYDNPDDDADKLQAEILAIKISNLANLAKIGLEMQTPLLQAEELKKIAADWEILPNEITGREAPAVLGAMLKELYGDDIWEVNNYGEFKKIEPILKNRDKEQAEFLYKYLGTIYSQNGLVKHQNEVVKL